MICTDQKHWAKYESKTGEYHLVRYHCLDVAAMFQTILEKHQRTYDAILKPFLPEDREEVFRFLCFMAALHDLGKFGAFQGIIEDLCKKLGHSPAKEDYHHSTAGWILWDYISDDFVSLCPRTKAILSYYEQHIFGHHGYPPFASWKDTERGLKIKATIKSFDLDDVAPFIEACYALFGRPKFPSHDRIDLDEIKAVQWVLNGAMVFADWMGSTTSNFPFKQDIIPLEDYYHDPDTGALASASKALDDLNYLPKEIKIGTSFKDLYPEYQPRPTQQVMEDLEFGDGAQLLIIEDATGSGKTEAAILAARIMISKLAAEGIYFGLPTQVSAEAMLQRVANVCAKFFDKENPVLGAFASGSARVSDFYKEIKKGVTDGIESHEWLNKKSALLSQMGAGTIDQALMAVLAKNHQGLRLYGLHRNVLIIDEVHAYQTYQITLLKSLLKQCRKLDIPVILLSATLPQERREKLVRAYSRGKGKVDKEKGYPLVTYWRPDTPLIEKEVEASAKRTYEIETFYDEERIESIVESHKEDGCGAVFVNTVKRAVKVYERLCHVLGRDSVYLAHSRFAQYDRNQIESEALRLFGKDSTPAERAGKVVVCTQVFQESINLDFDYGILDLAAIDSLFQRMGRVRRYIRNLLGLVDDTCEVDARGAKIPIYVYGPKPVKDPDKKWYSSALKSADFVYRDTSVLWNTMNVLERKTDWNFPGDARELMESVYGPNRIVWKSLEERDLEVQGQHYSDQGAGNQNRVKFHKTFMKSNGHWVTDVKLPTRLGYPTKTVALCKENEDGELVPIYKGYAEYSQFQVPAGQAHEELMSTGQEKKFEAAIEDRNKPFFKDRDFLTYIVLEPTDQDDVWEGSVLVKTQGGIQPKLVGYSKEKGYQLVS